MSEEVSEKAGWLEKERSQVKNRALRRQCNEEGVYLDLVVELLRWDDPSHLECSEVHDSFGKDDRLG